MGVAGMGEDGVFACLSSLLRRILVHFVQQEHLVYFHHRTAFPDIKGAGDIVGDDGHRPDNVGDSADRLIGSVPDRPIAGAF